MANSCQVPEREISQYEIVITLVNKLSQDKDAGIFIMPDNVTANVRAQFMKPSLKHHSHEKDLNFRTVANCFF